MKYLPYVFTKHGITMLAGIQKSDIAIDMSLRIVETFISMKKYISNSLIEHKHINSLVLEHEIDIKLLQESFDKLNENKSINGLFFEGQFFDSYSILIDILNTSTKNIIIIDNKYLYHCGASLNDLGKKCFAIVKIENKIW